MPYVPVELDDLNDFPHVARAGNISEDTATGGILRMWARVFRTQDPHLGDAVLLGLFGAPVGPALAAFDFIEATDKPGVWKLKRNVAALINAATAKNRGGKKRTDTAQRDAKGRLLPEPKDPDAQLQLPVDNPVDNSSTPPDAGPARPAGVQQDSSSFTQHPTPNTQTPKTSSSVEAEEPGGKVLRFPPKKPEEDEAIRVGKALEQASGQPFWAWMQHQRDDLGLSEEREPKEFQEWCWRALARVGIRALSSSYGRFLLDKDFQLRGWPVRVWMHENVWVQRAYDERRDGM